MERILKCEENVIGQTKCEIYVVKSVIERSLRRRDAHTHRLTDRETGKERSMERILKCKRINKVLEM